MSWAGILYLLHFYRVFLFLGNILFFLIFLMEDLGKFGITIGAQMGRSIWNIMETN